MVYTQTIKSKPIKTVITLFQTNMHYKETELIIVFL